MRWAVTLVIVASLQVSAARTHAQSITFSGKDVQLNEIFSFIEKQTGYFILFNKEQLKHTGTISVEVKNVLLDDFFKLILEGFELDFTIENKTVFIRRKQSSLIILEEHAGPVKGQVVGEDGRPLIGASVKIKGSNLGTITDGEGRFSLQASNGDVLVVSFVGFAEASIRVTDGRGSLLPAKENAATLSNMPDGMLVRMSFQRSPLDEVQVIAYGTTTTRFNTGNIATVKGEEIEKQPVTNPLLALQGRVPGLFITQFSGFANTGVKVVIQGENSMNRGNDPFYVVDGVPYSSQMPQNLGDILGRSGDQMSEHGNPLAFINPADIESITVLKDADATSIYGSRAANGAILITTKKGKTGRTRMDINVQNGWGTVTRHRKMLNTQQYLEMRREAIANDGGTIGEQDFDINGFWDTTRYTDWQKVLLGKAAQYTQANVSVSGGTGGTRFLLAGTYNRNTNVFPSDFANNKASAHFKLNHTSGNQRLNMQFSTMYMNDNNRLPLTDPTGTAMFLPPNAPALYNADGSLNWMPNELGAHTFFNPMAAFEKSYTARVNNLVTSMSIGYKILRNLELSTNFGYTITDTKDGQQTPMTAYAPEDRATAGRSAQYGFNTNRSFIIEPQLTYNQTIGNGKLDAIVGATIQQRRGEVFQVSGYGHPNDAVLNDLNAATAIYPGPNIQSVYKYAAVFGRMNYNLQDKYLFNLTARRDGSSRFGPENRFNSFASIGAGWIFSEENFMQSLSQVLSFGKLRFSYGTTGNDNIGEYQYMSLYTSRNYTLPYQGVTGLAPDGLINPELQWEQTNKMNAGIDLSFFNERVSLNANYYRNRSSNQLISQPLPIFAGGSILRNMPATVQNTGLEVAITSRNISKKNFEWSTDLNFSIPRNKLVRYEGIEKSYDRNWYLIGYSIDMIKLYKFAGVNPETGVYQYLNHKGELVTTPNYDTDRLVLINFFRSLGGGFGNTIRYKQFQLSAFMEVVLQDGMDSNTGSGTPGGRLLNQPAIVMNRWRKPGDVTNIQRFNANGQWEGPFGNTTFSDATYRDMSFARIKNVSLTWQMPSAMAERLGIQGASLFADGQNLLTITRFNGLDPESRSNWNTTLPPLRIVTVGLKLNI